MIAFVSNNRLFFDIILVNCFVYLIKLAVFFKLSYLRKLTLNYIAFKVHNTHWSRNS